MQIWFFFTPGSGGDGIANLVERANNFVPYDGETDWWRVHRFVDNKPKFYAPTPDTDGCFRAGQRFDLQHNQLNPGYQDCILKNQNCVVASHDVTLSLLDNSDCKDIFYRDQIKVLLLMNAEQAIIDATTKNLSGVLPNRIPNTKFNESSFDFVLDVARLQSDWQYVNHFCQSVGADLAVEQYQQYQDILKGNKTYMANNFGIEEYTSKIVGNNITYTLVNTWQSTATQSIT